MRGAVEADMVGFVLHAVDGTKIAARVPNRGGWHKKKLLALLEKLDRKITELEKQLEETSVCDAPDDALPKELGECQALRKKVRSALHRLEEKNKTHLHPSDEDACVMPCKEQNRNAFAYNGQAVTDEHSGILVACEATTDCNDKQQLNAMLDKVQEQAGQNAECTLADTGPRRAKKRGYLIEPVFAFIKRHLGFRRFTHYGLCNIQAQCSLMCTTYNLHQLFQHWKRVNTPSPPAANTQSQVCCTG